MVMQESTSVTRNQLELSFPRVIGAVAEAPRYTPTLTDHLEFVHSRCQT